MNSILDFLLDKKSIIATAALQHLYISFGAVLIGSLLAVPLGIYLARKPRIAGPIMTVIGIIQTIPSLVLFGLAMPFLGIGLKTGLSVLILYSILPVLLNTYTGIKEIDHKYVEAARGMGMSSRQILFKVELPIALPVIISGIRIAVVYIISWATIAALIGAGGLGDLIFTGLQTYNYNMILAGAIPACALALLSGSVIGTLQRIVTPRGLKS